MSDKIYNGKIKSIETSKVIARKGKRRILLSIIGIGDAFINWNKTPKWEIKKEPNFRKIFPSLKNRVKS